MIRRVPCLAMFSLLLVLKSLAIPTCASAVETPLASTDMRKAGACPLYDAEVERATGQLETMIKRGVQVPTPVDPGGGYTHEQHKRNYQAILLGGLLFQETGNTRYSDYVRDVLLAYARMYPTLGPHPARKHEEPGRLFWQNLNDSVWLVNSIQGYAAIRDTLTPPERKLIEEGLLLPAARFLSSGSPRTFGRIHNHATWAAAAVGMTGYVLGNKELVKIALLGQAKDGKSGFLRQMDELFSPDGYYTEGPYYQRYALLPFLAFADAIERNEPKRRIFERRDGILMKALRSTIELTYNGYFFPINDAMKDKSLRTEELYQGIAIGYAHTFDPQLLDIVRWQGRTVMGEQGRRVACDLAANQARPFPFASQLFRDGPQGGRGALAILRAGPAWGDATLVAKNTAQGMGHGHFDKLGWLYFDNDNEIISDYGAARFLNIEAKQGGIYLPENTSWAKQTIAHNTLVVDERSHFDGDVGKAEVVAPRQLYFDASAALQISSASIDGAYPGVKITRSMAMLRVNNLSQPLIVDLLRVTSRKPHQYDLPLHYQGHIMRAGPALQSNVAERPLLGKANGYQHLWVDARAQPTPEQAYLTWLQGNRFYTWRWIPQPGAETILAESGANDPNFNLRREPVLIQRVRDVTSTLFAGVLEAHGRYDGASEQTTAGDSQIRSLTRTESEGMDLLDIDMLKGGHVVLAFSYEPDPLREHRMQFRGHELTWRGFAARFDFPVEGESSHEH